MADLQSVSTSDSPNSGREKWNANDTELASRIDAANSALTTHKSSSDHDAHNDARYPAESDFTTLQSTVSGLGTSKVDAADPEMTGDAVVKKASPAFIGQNADGTEVYRRTGGSDDSTAIMEDHVNVPGTGPVVTQRFNSEHGYIEFPNHDVYSQGKRLVPMDEVQARIKSQYFTMRLSRYVSSWGVGNYDCNQADGHLDLLMVPPGARIIQIQAMFSPDSAGVANSFAREEVDLSYSFPTDYDSRRTLWARLVTSSGGGFYSAKFDFYVRDKAGADTLIGSTAWAQWSSAPSNIYGALTFLLTL